jgi:hypothetical protein
VKGCWLDRCPHPYRVTCPMSTFSKPLTRPMLSIPAIRDPTAATHGRGGRARRRSALATGRMGDLTGGVLSSSTAHRPHPRREMSLSSRSGTRTVPCKTTVTTVWAWWLSITACLPLATASCRCLGRSTHRSAGTGPTPLVASKRNLGPEAANDCGLAQSATWRRGPALSSTAGYSKAVGARGRT